MGKAVCSTFMASSRRVSLRFLLEQHTMYSKPDCHLPVVQRCFCSLPSFGDLLTLAICMKGVKAEFKNMLRNTFVKLCNLDLCRRSARCRLCHGSHIRRSKRQVGCMCLM